MNPREELSPQAAPPGSTAPRTPPTPRDGTAATGPAARLAAPHHAAPAATAPSTVDPARSTPAEHATERLRTVRAWIATRPAWVHGAAVVLMLAGAWAAVWASGGTARALPHAFYIPILTAAYFFTWRGTLITSLAATALCGPLMPLLTDPPTAQTTTSWVIRGAFFVGIGLLAAVTQAARTRAEEREVAHDVLVQLRPGAEPPVEDALVPLVPAMLRTQDFHTVLQPIYSLVDGRLLGVEALTRFGVAPTHGPDRWFAAASSLGLGTELELAAIARALDAGATLPAGVALSVNASPETLADPRLTELLRARAHQAVTIEITENAVVEDYPLLRDVTDRLRALGIRIAVDDAGAGVASLHHIVQLAPDAIKLDLSLTQDMAASSLRRSLATALVEFAYRTNALLIVEGIETEADLVAWRSLGAHAVQGNLTGRPTRHHPPLFSSRVTRARSSGPRFPAPRRAASRLS